MTEEIWMPCPEFEKHYMISNLGRLRSREVFIPHDGMFGDDGGYTKHIKIKNQTENRYGYLTSKLCKDGNCRRLTIHRLVAKAFLENPKKLSQVNHIDGNKHNNVVTNLEWISPSGNIKHAYATGLMNAEHLKGENNKLSKLTNEKVEIIRNKLLNGETCTTIAREFDVSPSTIRDIKNNKTWKK